MNQNLISQTISVNKDIEKFIEELYQNKTGFNITEEERKKVSDAGGSPVYGEIKFESTKKLLDKFKITKNDVIYDLGCGIGKFIIQTYLSTPAKKVVGIELSPTRFKVGHELLENQKLKNITKDSKREIKFINDDIAKADLSDATLIYMCSTCYPESLMKSLTEKFATLKPGANIITLKRLPEHNKIEFLEKETQNLPMTWSTSVAVYFYKVKDSSKNKPKK